jgi:hypothetical protein
VVAISSFQLTLLSILGFFSPADIASFPAKFYCSWCLHFMLEFFSQVSDYLLKEEQNADSKTYIVECGLLKT